MKDHQRLSLSLFLAVLAQCLVVQRDREWTLAAGLALYGVAVFLFLFPSRAPSAAGKLPFRTELGLAALLGGLAVFLRVHRLMGIPPGMTTDETCGPWLGYAVPPGQWDRYYPDPYPMTYPDIFHWAYAWFHLFPPTHLSYSLFYVFLSLLALPLGYLFFRGLAGPFPALLALFFWGIMQWHITLSRNGHCVISAVFFIMATVAFARLAWERRNLTYWVLTGVFAGFGLYSHPGFRPCLLFLVLALLYEMVLGKGSKPFGRGLAACLLAFAVVAWPAFRFMAHQHSIIGSWYDHYFVGWRVLQERSLSPLLDNLSRTFLLFNHAGPMNTQENLSGHRLLDDVTGILFLLGCFLAVKRWRERKYFYGVLGLGVLSLPSVLSNDPLHTSRILGIAPFVAYLASLACLEIWERAGRARRTFLVLGVLAAVVAVGENFKIYFQDRPLDETCWREGCVDSTRTGQAVADGGDRYEYYLSSIFSGRFNVMLLGHAQAGHMHSLEMEDTLRPLHPPPGRGLFFALQEGRTGVLAILQERYPGGATEKLLDPWGRAYLYLFKVPPEAVKSFVPPPPGHAWKGTYWTSLAPQAPPFLRQKAPVLNFSYRDDFPLKNTPVLKAEWRGTLHPARAGLYRFLLATTDFNQVELELDGKKVAVANQEVSLDLKPRDYPVVVRLRKEGGFANALHLAWKPPGADRYEIIPPEALK
jgi:hypothetical protein